MNLGVVVSAEETEVVDDGFASVDPPDDVVDVAPFGRSVTSWGDAVTVAGGDGPTETGGDYPGFASVVEDL